MMSETRLHEELERAPSSVREGLVARLRFARQRVGSLPEAVALSRIPPRIAAWLIRQPDVAGRSAGIFDVDDIFHPKTDPYPGFGPDEPVEIRPVKNRGWADAVKDAIPMLLVPTLANIAAIQTCPLSPRLARASLLLLEELGLVEEDGEHLWRLVGGTTALGELQTSVHWPVLQALVQWDGWAGAVLSWCPKWAELTATTGIFSFSTSFGATRYLEEKPDPDVVHRRMVVGWLPGPPGFWTVSYDTRRRGTRTRTLDGSVKPTGVPEVDAAALLDMVREQWAVSP